ncbi:MAG: mevalonate kinase [Chloroflexi bacterium HGW-Chloroflexi-8]|jgi:mevalonate kinase|nr:MAG: mevalonate kinase [Chloroflexi bacterium HGW-Chloroflexi-8]
MPAIVAKAPAKTILVGEHAVVYNQPAIAFPINQIKAKTTILANPNGQPDEIIFHAQDIFLDTNYMELPGDHPFRVAVDIIKKEARIHHYPACTVRISSEIPIAAGLGSSAAISVSLVKGLSLFVGLKLNNQKIADLAYQIEIKYHGTPSGIDNTVISFNQPIYFIKNKGFHIINPKENLTFVIANSGILGNTKEAVSGVKKRWHQNQDQYNELFNKIGQIVANAENAIISGDIKYLGSLLTENHKILTQIGVSHPILDTMVKVAISSGALGAKLCGSGLGGNMIALTPPDLAEKIAGQLEKAGAVQTIIDVVQKAKNE